MKLIPFKSFLSELFQQHYPFTKAEKFGHNYHFKTDTGHNYHVSVAHHQAGSKHVAHVDFSQTNSTNDAAKMSATHNQSSGAIKVFSTVHHILKHHMEQHPHIHSVNFSADNSEPSRVKLYQHLVKRFANKYTERNSFGVHHFQILHKDIK